MLGVGVDNIDKDRDLICQVMEVELELLRRLKELCEKHDLQMYMIYGTLLGAVRHQGIIPGDDDIDIAMPREDYEKLLKLEGAFSGEYFLQTPWNDNCFYGGFLKLRKKNTTAIHPQNWWVDCCEGIGIDIFPLDNGYYNKIKEWFKEKRICFYQRMLYAKAYGYFKRFRDIPFLIWKGYRYLGKLFTRAQLANRLNEIMSSGDNVQVAPFGIYAHYTSGKGFQKLDREAFSEKITLPFEDMWLDAPAGYDELLSKRYKKDYMQIPLHQEDKYRHGFYVVNVPYENYKRRFRGLFRPEPKGRDIILAGDEVMFRVFLKCQQKYQPKVFIDLFGKIYGKKMGDIPIKPLEYLDSLDKNKIYLVLCSVDIRRAEEVVRSMDYLDYYIYVWNRNWLLMADPEYALKDMNA